MMTELEKRLMKYPKRAMIVCLAFYVIPCWNRLGGAGEEIEKFLEDITPDVKLGNKAARLIKKIKAVKGGRSGNEMRKLRARNKPSRKHKRSGHNLLHPDERAVRADGQSSF